VCAMSLLSLGDCMRGHVGQHHVVAANPLLGRLDHMHSNAVAKDHYKKMSLIHFFLSTPWNVMDDVMLRSSIATNSTLANKFSTLQTKCTPETIKNLRKNRLHFDLNTTCPEVLKKEVDAGVALIGKFADCMVEQTKGDAELNKVAIEGKAEIEKRRIFYLCRMGVYELLYQAAVKTSIIVAGEKIEKVKGRPKVSFMSSDETSEDNSTVTTESETDGDADLMAAGMEIQKQLGSFKVQGRQVIESVACDTMLPGEIPMVFRFLSDHIDQCRYPFSALTTEEKKAFSKAMELEKKFDEMAANVIYTLHCDSVSKVKTFITIMKSELAKEHFFG